MNYPLLSEYIEAIKAAEENFAQLKHLRPVLGEDEQPIMSSGNFAVVFKMKDEQTGKLHAVKCFLKEQEGRAEAYRLIAEELEYVSSTFLTPIKYFDKELFVDTTSSDETEFPVLLMDWVEGHTLDKYIREHIDDLYELSLLAYQFSRLAMWLMPQPFAHGDLKADNILVKDDGTLVLVDYDGMYVPAMKGQRARELGSPDFRHPSRTEEVFDEHIDDFSLVSILLSLKAISLQPNLLEQYGASDRLLFSANDYRNLSESQVMDAIKAMLQDAELATLYSLFILSTAQNNLSQASFRLLNLSRPNRQKSETWTPHGESFNIKEYWKTVGSVVDVDIAEVIVENSANGETSYAVTVPFKDGSFVELILDDDCYLDKGDIIRISSITGQEYHKDGYAPIIRYSGNAITEVAEEDLSNAWTDEYGAKYSEDKKRLLKVPKELNHYSIKNGTRVICDNALFSCKDLNTVELPSSIEIIGNYSFTHCENLSSISFPQSVIYIGRCAFYNCKKLTQIVIPSNVKTIKSGAFSNIEGLNSIIVDSENRVYDSRYNCNAIIETCTNTLINGCISSVIPTDISAIGDYAFENVRLNSIIIPNGVKTIGSFAFSRKVPHTYLLSRLEKLRFGNKLSTEYKKISIPESVNKIGIGAFRGYGDFSIEVDSKNHYYDSRNNCNAIIDTANKTLLIGCSLSKIPVGVRKIESNAFCECIDLESIKLPEGLEVIGDEAFKNCDHLLSIVIPNSVVSIKKGAFAGCEYLQSVTLSSNLTRIEDSTFKGCFRLHSISIPKSVTTIGDYAFEFCSNLSLAELPNSIKTIGNSAFSDCKGITSMSIPNCVTSIGKYAFAGCCVSSIIIPENVSQIGQGAFNCYGLTSIIVDQKNKHYDSRHNCNAIIDSETNTLIEGCSSTVIPDDILIIGERAFSCCDELTFVTIPHNVKRVGNYAFDGCTDLETMEFLGIIESTGNHILDEDSGLPSIIVPNGTRLKYEQLLSDYKTNLFERVFIDNNKGKKRVFGKEEIETVNKAEVVQGTYTKMVCFHLSDGCQKYIPLCNQSLLSLGDSVDLHKAELIILDGEGINYGIGADGRDDIQKYIVEV